MRKGVQLVALHCSNIKEVEVDANENRVQSASQILKN